MTAPLCALPMELKCEIFSQLSDTDRLRLKCVSRSLKDDIEIEYPKHMAKLTTARRIELGWMKFQDRPLYQKVGLVALCIIFSPVIALYHSKDIMRWILTLYTPRMRQLVQRICKTAAELVRTSADWCLDKILRISKSLFDNIAVPLARAIKCTAQFSYDQILTPAATAIKGLFTRIVIPTCRAILTHIVVPACRLSINHVIVPLARFAIKNVAVPVCRQLVRITTWTYGTIATRIVVPACRFSIDHIIVPLARFALKNVVIPACRQLVRIIRWTYSTIAVPVARMVHAIAKGLLITLPQKVYQFILTPIGHLISRISTLALTHILKPVYHHVLTPIGRCIHLAGRITHERVLTPLAILTQSLARVVFIQVPVETYNFLLLQAQIVQRYFTHQ